jgi:O-6-methylguanine DNA methyltransferase
LQLLLSQIPSPIGDIVLVSDGQTLRGLDFHDHEARLRTLLHRQYGAHSLAPAPDRTGATAALNAYFAGDLAALNTLSIATAGTEFQRDIWSALRLIPAGETTTYARLAASIGRPRAVRATGAANGANPISLVLPCHRVIGADGSLTGYGGGLPRKAWLLAHEVRHSGK